MKIKRLEILGFKSFQDKVSLDFPRAITGVVGPNGCGKSNVVDAIRWVMGEQSARNLRGTSMEDVIFGGTELRKPLGMAEVSLFFSLDDGCVPARYLNFSEIQVTRRLYRSGESEYFLNKTHCRLLDVAELFMDTGIGARAYSIIEQGKIGLILQAKPQERRFLIEEAAGVTKFKARKIIALKKIEATRQNLLRISDIVSEIRRQLNGLQRQSKKAEHFRETRQELKEIELLFAAKGYASLARERQGLEAEVVRIETLARDLDVRLAAEDLAVEADKISLLENEHRLAAAREEIFRWKAELQAGENRLEFQRRELAGLERQGAKAEEELLGLKEQLAASERELAALSGQRGAFLQELSREGATLEQRETVLAEATGREAALTREMDTARRALFTALSDQALAANQHAAARKRLITIGERLQAGARERSLLGARLVESRLRGEELTRELQELLREKALSREELNLATASQGALREVQGQEEKRLQQSRDELSAAASRLTSLRELEAQFAGYGQGVRNLLLAEPFKDASFTMLADALEVAEECEVPLEAALGERLQYLLCDSKSLALEAVAHLKGAAGGRCSFVTAPPWCDPPGEPSPAAPALLDKVSVAERFASLVVPILSGIYLARDLPHAVALAASFPRCTFVTLTGDLAHAGGIVNGGSSEPAQQGIIHKKKEIKGLGFDVERLNREVRQLSREREARIRQIVAAEARRLELGQGVHRLEIRILSVEKDLQSAAAECRRIEESATVREQEQELLAKENSLVAGELALAEAATARAASQKQLLDTSIAALQGRLEGSRSEMEAAREQVTSLKVKVAARTEQVKAAERASLRVEGLSAQLAPRISSRTLELEGSGVERARLSEAIALGEQALREVVACQLRSEQALLLVTQQYEAAAARVDGEEKVLRAGRCEAATLRDLLSARSLGLSGLLMKLSHLEETLQQKYRVEIADVLACYEELQWDAAERGARQAELQRLIDEMGEVNLMAIEEFRQMEERYSFLCAQKDDLEESMNALHKAIQRINRTTRKRFLETFELVNDKFQQVFPRLFCGGHAELRLTDEEDLLSTGLDIVVQPPGKKLQNVSLLSGGEKALTAVALIFAIFLIKPTPFCLLDEVDAPLDDANIGRFNEMVREMSTGSQFIIITHNRATMAVADTLYGVTMQEPGVSKLVSVRLNV